MRFRTNMELPESIFAFIGGYLHAIDPLTGETNWQTKLPRAQRSALYDLKVDAKFLFLGTAASIYAIDRFTGRLDWHTKLPKQFVAYHSEIALAGDILLIGSSGYLHALDKLDGRILWTNGFKGRGHGIVRFHVEPSDAAPCAPSA
ncbi:PQQ-binding-like beta-propeller repeat protein [Planctomycetota bacterium]|nr:PQQ-binding-like beta-propeller repeat protein [Planctomycetota bacterium]